MQTTHLTTLVQRNQRTYEGSILLTRREYDVLHLVVLGHTDKEISEALHISPLTARNHVQRLREKFSVPNRGKIGPAAREAGFLDKR
jgi:DNA-binding CsgD family transcriptional regulator